MYERGQKIVIRNNAKTLQTKPQDLTNNIILLKCFNSV